VWPHIPLKILHPKNIIHLSYDISYDALVWTIIVIYALGGLTAAMVMMYADNILKVTT
jgi:hypothetical protein